MSLLGGRCDPEVLRSCAGLFAKNFVKYVASLNPNRYPIGATPIDVWIRLRRASNATRARMTRAVTADVLALASKLRKRTIESISATSDVELGLHALLKNRQPCGR